MEKNYKKKHGYNPPFEADKRQKAKAAKKARSKKQEKNIYISSTTLLANKLKVDIMGGLNVMFDALSTIFSTAGKAAGKIAKDYKEIAEAYGSKEER